MESIAELQAEVEALLPELEAVGHETAMAEVCVLLGFLSFWLGRYSRATELLERARVLGTRSGASWAVSLAFAVLPALMPPATLIERWRELSGSIRLSRGARARGDIHVAEALAMTGDLEGARALYREVRQMQEESGEEMLVYSGRMFAGTIEMLAGDHEAARELLEEGDRGLERLGEYGFHSTVLTLLADALQALGRSEEAIGVTDRSASMSAVDDVEANADWRFAKARALADLGSFGEAVRLAREALDVLADTEASTQASSSSLAYVLASAGRTAEALDAYRTALEMYERKGNVVSAARVRRTMAILRGEDPGPAELPPGAWGTTWPRGG